MQDIQLSGPENVILRIPLMYQTKGHSPDAMCS